MKLRAALACFLTCAFLPVLVLGVITLKDNGYKGITVAIHRRVPYDPKLVESIKYLFESGSSFLYEATRHRAYFNEVTIVVPGEWEHRPEYEIVRAGNRFSTADVRLDLPNPAYGDGPYTLQPGECGDSGDYVHLTPEFVKSVAENKASAYGDPGRALVHEWAHLRYGVFDEHGYQNDDRTPAFYMDSNNQIRHTSCTANVPGWLRDRAGQPCHGTKDGLPDEECLFYPDLQTATTKASIMSVPYLPTVDGFCDDTDERRHNALAPSMHNLMCQGRSTWAVLMDHPDFVQERNPSRDHIDPIPLFRVVQPKKDDNPTFVLVLDVSASMRGRRIELLHRAAARFIKYQLSEYSSLGMVAFSTDVQILANVTTLDKTTRDRLADVVPEQEEDGYTAIGAGILAGLKLLRDGREPTEGALLLLVTDGEENVDPFLETILPEILKSRVTINTVAFGRDASTRLEKLITMTGGRGFFYDDERVSHNALGDAFLESASTQSDIELQPVEVISRYRVMEKDEELTANFTLDKDIGSNTVFLVTYDYPRFLEVVLIAPTGKKYDSRSREFTDDSKTSTISIDIPEAQPGRWTYIIKNKQSFEQDVSVVVTSEAKDIREQPIRVRAWVGDVELTFPAQAKVYAEVKKEYNAIIDASVIATIARPDGDPHIMMLFDNGAGADMMADDGIYSGYFTQFNGSGRYSVEAVVLNNGKARVKLGSMASSVPKLRQLDNLQKHGQAAQFQFSPDDLPILEVEAAPLVQYTPVENFERAITAGSFKVDGWKDGDFIPPNQIKDLHVSHARWEDEHVVVRLSWTAPGDDMDEGNAEEIEIRYHADQHILLYNFTSGIEVTIEDIVHGSLTPAPVGNAQVVGLKIPKSVEWNATSPVLFFAVVGRDEAGNYGKSSNLGMIVYPHRASAVATSFPLVMVIVIIGVTVLVILLIIVFVCLRSKNRQRKYECKHQHKLLPSSA